MSVTEAIQDKPALLAEPPQRLHHHAYVVRDQEVNRRFFEDLLGIPLVATWCEQHHNTWLGRDVAMCHTFFAMGDGGALAFFAFGDPEVYKLVIAEKPPVVGSFDHVAFKVSDRTYTEIVDRLKRAAEQHRRNRPRLLQVRLRHLARRPDRRIHRRSPRRRKDRSDPPSRRPFRARSLDGR